MKTFNPRVPCLVRKVMRYDLHGEPVHGDPVPMMCDVLDVTQKREQTDASGTMNATQGRSEELRAGAMFLFAVSAGIAQNDTIEVRGVKYCVSALRDRYDWRGRLEHVQVEATIE